MTPNNFVKLNTHYRYFWLKQTVFVYTWRGKTYENCRFYSCQEGLNLVVFFATASGYFRNKCIKFALQISSYKTLLQLYIIFKLYRLYQKFLSVLLLWMSPENSYSIVTPIQVQWPTTAPQWKMFTVLQYNTWWWRELIMEFLIRMASLMTRKALIWIAVY
jgi:hypothetical protein